MGHTRLACVGRLLQLLLFFTSAIHRSLERDITAWPLCRLEYFLTETLPLPSRRIHSVFSTGRLLPFGPLQRRGTSHYIITDHETKASAEWLWASSISFSRPYPGVFSTVGDVHLCPNIVPDDVALLSIQAEQFYQEDQKAYCTLCFSRPMDDELKRLRSWSALSGNYGHLSCDSEVATLKEADAHIEGRGFHTYFAVTLPVLEQPQEAERCHHSWGVLIFLSDSVYVEPGEIERWAKAEGNVTVPEILGTIDLEVPQYDEMRARPLVIYFESEANETPRTLKVPIHLRYHRPSTDGSTHFLIEHVRPYTHLFSSCDPKDASTRRSASTVLLMSLQPRGGERPTPDDETGLLTQEIPVARMEDQEWVRLVSLGLAWMGALVVIVAVCRVRRPCRDGAERSAGRISPQGRRKGA